MCSRATRYADEEDAGRKKNEQTEKCGRAYFAWTLTFSLLSQREEGLNLLRARDFLRPAVVLFSSVDHTSGLMDAVSSPLVLTAATGLSRSSERSGVFISSRFVSVLVDSARHRLSLIFFFSSLGNNALDKKRTSFSSLFERSVVQA